ncbi:Mannose-6-phosphate isomerase [Candidatus Paraburkholderia kirkii]|nr:Mannose-6-phosphate isomerase [Candidatus Paraburkholderia kirkii]
MVHVEYCTRGLQRSSHVSCIRQPWGPRLQLHRPRRVETQYQYWPSPAWPSRHRNLCDRARDGRKTIEHETLVVTTGDVVVNPPNGTHGLVNVGKTLLKLVVIDVPVAHDSTS